MKRAPVLNSYQENGFLDMFPLHDQELLKRLKDDWFKAPLLQVSRMKVLTTRGRL